jgi:hypothetical protein
MPKILPPHLEALRDRSVHQIAEIQKMLTLLESGQMHLGSREGDGPWCDTTQEWIQRHKENIGTYEAILKALDAQEPI